MNHFLDGLTLASILNFGAGALALLAAIFSGRAALGVLKLRDAMDSVFTWLGRPKDGRAAPMQGETLREQVDFLGSAQVRANDNQYLIAQSLRQVADEIAALRGTGKRRLPTDSIPLPPNGDYLNGK